MVVAVGPGKRLENGSRVAMSVSKGDTVVYAQGYGTTEVQVDGDELLIMRESELLGVVPGLRAISALISWWHRPLACVLKSWARVE